MEKQKKFLIQLLYFTSIACLLYLFFRTVFIWLFPFFLALGCTAILHELAKKCTFLPCSLSFKRNGLLLIFLSSFLLLLSLFSYYLFDFLFDLLLLFPKFYTTQFSVMLSKASQQLSTILPSSFILYGTELLQTNLAQLSSYCLKMLTQFTTLIPKLFSTLFLSTIFLCFICPSYDQLLIVLHRWHPYAAFQANVSESLVAIKKMSHAIFKIMFITWIILQIGFFVLRLENSFLWASLIALADALPFVGTSLFLIPWSIFAYLMGSSSRSIGLLVIAVLISMIHQFLEPRWMGQVMGVPPVIVMLFMILTTKIFGISGILIAPILLVGLSLYMKKP